MKQWVNSPRLLNEIIEHYWEKNTVVIIMLVRKSPLKWESNTRSSEVIGWYFPSHVRLTGILQVSDFEEWYVLGVTHILLCFGPLMCAWNSHAHFIILTDDYMPLVVHCELVDIAISSRILHKWLWGVVLLQRNFLTDLVTNTKYSLQRFRRVFSCGFLLAPWGIDPERLS